MKNRTLTNKNFPWIAILCVGVVTLTGFQNCSPARFDQQTGTLASKSLAGQSDSSDSQTGDGSANTAGDSGTTTPGDTAPNTATGAVPDSMPGATADSGTGSGPGSVPGSGANTTTGQASPTSPVSTGNPTVDRQAQEVVDAISKADPEFDVRNVFYLKFDMLGTLLNLLIERLYKVTPESCTSKFNFSLLGGFLSQNGTRNLDVKSCDGFKRALVVKANNGGAACRVQAVSQRHFALANLISFDRTTEIDANCLCFHRYKMTMLNNVNFLGREVRTFASDQACADNFDEYR